MAAPKVYIIAGEPSGDLLASGLMKALRESASGVRFRGVGGEAMTAVAGNGADGEAQADGTASGGFESLFDISEISVMGIFEVIPRLPLILRRIRQTVKDIEEFAPDVLVTVDSWGFVSSVLAKLRKRGSKVPRVHYVAPQVWAWKEGRAKNVAKLVDRLMTLLPDEGKYFEKYGLRCDFVGHPVVERVAEMDLDPAGFRAANGIPPTARVISVLPGSRPSEIKRLLPILKEAIEKLIKESQFVVSGIAMQQIFVVVPTVATVEEEVRRGFDGFGVPVRVVSGTDNRYNAFAVSEIALAKSGTVSLELAAVGVPHLIAYTFNRLSNLAARLLVKIRFANLINIIAGREIIPEFVLGDCRAELIAGCADGLLASPEAAARQVAGAQEILQRLRLPDILPSERAAQIVIEETN